MSTEPIRKRDARTIVVSRRELWLIRAALQEYLATFSHTEPDMVHEIKTLLEHLPQVPDGRSSINQIFPEGRGVTM